MSDYLHLSIIIASIFVLLGLGAFFSPSYSDQMSYAQWFLFGGGILFMASVVILVAAAGFRSFALYLVVLVALAITAFGLYGGWLVLLMTYGSWGFAFSMQLLLVYHEVPSAIDWFKRYYTYPVFYIEFRIFYPMVQLLFFLLEIVPRLMRRDRADHFDPAKVFAILKRILPQK